MLPALLAETVAILEQRSDVALAGRTHVGAPGPVALSAGGLLYVGLLMLTRAIPRDIAVRVPGRGFADSKGPSGPP